MIVFLLTLGIVVTAMIFLAVGVLAGRRPLRSSCGGNALVRLCPVCTEGDRS